MTLSAPESATVCVDQECGGIAEPEQDGDLHYYECLRCGYAFGYRQVVASTVAVNPDGACSVGIPEDVRRKASAPMQNSLAQQATKQLPLLSIGRRHDDSAP